MEPTLSETGTARLMMVLETRAIGRDRSVVGKIVVEKRMSSERRRGRAEEHVVVVRTDERADRNDRVATRPVLDHDGDPSGHSGDPPADAARYRPPRRDERHQELDGTLRQV